nr:Uncharacterised protein [Providencia rettgeri]CAD0189291.1 Hypothetical_protein [Providencia rettgeri]
MNLKKTRNGNQSCIFNNGFILFGMFLFEGSIRLNGFFFVLLYILSGANIFFDYL